MNMRNSIICLFSAVLMLAGCRERKAEQFQALPFPDVTPPGMVDDYQARADYAAEHFWDKFTDSERNYPSDSSLVSGVRKDDVESKFANWVGLLDMVDPKVAEKSVSRLFDRVEQCEKKDTSSNVFETLTGFVQKYFYDPNSPFRNEELYLPFVRKLAKCELIEDIVRSKYVREALMCSLNRPGTPATDFRFRNKYGKIRKLYSINAEWTLLFFSNPGCEACMNIINVLKDNPVISGMVKDKRLAVVNVYIDEDVEAWRSYMPVYPEQWYNGYDPDMVIRNELLYDVRAIPSLYLLDRKKNVIFKDAPEQKVFSYLENLSR